MLKSDWSKGVLFITIISIVWSVWGYYTIQAERQIEKELAEVGVTTLATIIGCPRTMGTCSAKLQYDVPVQDEPNGNRVMSKTYITRISMSCEKCDNNQGQQITIRYLPRDPTQIRILPHGADSRSFTRAIFLVIAILWFGVLVAFIQQKRKTKGHSGS